MTNQALQTICQIIVAIGIFLTAIGGFGVYIFGKKVQQEKEAVGWIKRSGSTIEK